jgi:amino acid adenylation domain-containing protein
MAPQLLLTYSLLITSEQDGNSLMNNHLSIEIPKPVSTKTTDSTYVRAQLAGAPALLNFPTHLARSPLQNYRERRLALSFSSALAAELNELCRTEDVTLHTLLLTAWHLLLSRYSGQSDVVIATPRLVRVNVSSDETFSQLLRKVKENCLRAYEKDEMPLETLIQELGVEPSLSYRPISQVTFELNHLPRIQPECIAEFPEYDLRLSLRSSQDSISGELIYDGNLFDEPLMTQLTGHLETLLKSIVADPEQPGLSLPLLNDQERQQSLVTWNDTRQDYNCEKYAHELFQEQVTRTPDAIAVEFLDQQLTYRELHERSNKLAHYLVRLGVKAETMVGLRVERSTEMVVAILGILKAGACYVPLDVNYPAERIAYMLQDAGIAILLTQQRFKDQSAGNGVGILCLDAEWELVNAESSESPAVELSPENLAYAIYTSGSTGRPKGVLLRHRGLSNLAQAQALGFGMSAENRVLQFASVSFDASVSEIFKTLLVGGCLCLEPQERLLAGPDLARSLRDRRIDTVTLPPSALATLRPEDLPGLKKIIVAGEPCSAELYSRWASGRRFFNAYGPTEVTVCATIGECNDPDRSPPIGRPIGNMEVYLLDSRLEPVPIGVTGELYVGGEGLARGYHNRPELTAERFIPHAYSTSAGARLYRTGDLARYLNDGRIEFLGRSDEQVKVRGFRVEPGEVESVLHHHPAVSDCLVMAVKTTGGEVRLAAYAIADSEPVNGDELKYYLRQRVPEYMVPAACFVLKRFPLTPNGKIDRNALPSPFETRSERADDYIVPTDPVERLLVEVAAEVLNIEKLGAHDNFFDVGGDSLRAAMFLNRLQEILGEVVYVVALFDAPTMAGLAVYLKKHYRSALLRVLEDDGWQDDESRIDEADSRNIAELRQAIRPIAPATFQPRVKNPRAVFILSPPRSGSTLLRVMLAGNPDLFAPPELQLLNCNSLPERLEVFSGRDSFWLEGTVRALMDIHDCDAQQATQIMRQCEDEGLTVQEFYLRMQQWVAPRILVDKTPSYTLDLQTLRRAEDYFDGALYVHLLRHPMGMIKSFTNAKLEQIFRFEHVLTAPVLAESIWNISHENILEFLSDVPAERQQQVRFEQLVSEPESVMRQICEFLGVPMHPDMLTPQKNKENKMTDGIHGLSRMLGDIKFHQHDKIDPRSADRWKAGAKPAEKLGTPTRELAAALGYEVPQAAENGHDMGTTLSEIVARPRRNRQMESVALI